MTKILTTVGFACCLFLATVLVAGGEGKEKKAEPYDEDTYGPEAPILWEKPVKTVIFQHKIHTMDAGLACDDCHDEHFEMENGAAEKKDDFTMASLYKGSYCGACHDGSTAFASNTRCTSCHIGVRGQARLQKTAK